MLLHFDCAALWAIRLLVIGAAGTLVATQSWADDYKVRSGDVLELAVVGASELGRRVPVEVNGTATFPIIGELQIDGIGIRRIRETVSARFANIIYRPNSQATGASPWVIQKTDVLLRVAVYRPVYVTGGVAKPGEVVFRPGITVQQAVSIAGGHDPFGARRAQTTSAADIVELQGELASTTLALAATRARIWRLRTALGENVRFRAKDPGVISPEAATKILSFEKAYLSSSTADLAQERAYLTNAIRQTNDRLAALKKQFASEQAGANLDEAEATKVDRLFSKGLVASERVGQARRIVLMSSTRALQTKATIARANHLKGELDSRLRRLDSLSKVKLIGELKEANASAMRLSQRLQTIKFKMVYNRLGPTRHEALTKSIFISRIDEDKKILADENWVLRPGDVVEVVFNRD
ncbi:MAG: polysaccharide biosynthesis/export family protein [Hyphomicrobiaceae bacterium]